MSRRRALTLPASVLPDHWKPPQRPEPTYPEYAQLKADAEESVRADGRMVDPVKLRRVGSLSRSWTWRVSVLGHDNERKLLDLHMLLLADERDLDPPLPQWLVDARAEAEAQDAEKARRRKARDDVDEAASAEALKDFPVKVTVLRNGTGRVRFGYVHHLGHIVPAEDVLSGSEARPRRHRAGRGLCETERRGRPLDLSGGEGGAATCVNCLSWAVKVRAAQ